MTDRLKPRKRPAQSRAVATVQAMFEATVQVLLDGGAAALSTGRVAERAGVSIGTFYQYFPGKEALIYALCAQHLDRASGAVEAACAQLPSNASLARCSDTFVTAYLDAKMANPPVSRVLYMASTAFDMSSLVEASILRLRTAAADMLLRAAPGHFADIEGFVFSWVVIVTGSTRQYLEHDTSEQQLALFRSHLLQMSCAHLEEARPASQ